MEKALPETRKEARARCAFPLHVPPENFPRFDIDDFMQEAAGLLLIYFWYDVSVWFGLLFPPPTRAAIWWQDAPNGPAGASEK